MGDRAAASRAPATAGAKRPAVVEDKRRADRERLAPSGTKGLIADCVDMVAPFWTLDLWPPVPSRPSREVRSQLRQEWANHLGQRSDLTGGERPPRGPKPAMRHGQGPGTAGTSILEAQLDHRFEGAQLGCPLRTPATPSLVRVFPSSPGHPRTIPIWSQPSQSKGGPVMTVSRRNVLLLGGLGVVGAGALSLPRGEVEAKSASRLSAAEMPKPFQSAFVKPPVLHPDKVEVDPADGRPVNFYTLTEKAAMASI